MSSRSALLFLLFAGRVSAQSGVAASETATPLPRSITAEAQHGKHHDPTGAFITVIPLALPEFRGLVPGLSLGYSSSSGDSLTGVGWQIQGLSMIRRVAPLRGVPRYDATDTFLLDGVELFDCRSLAPGSTAGCTHPDALPHDGYFATRADRGLRIAHDRAPRDRWIVWRQSGVRLEYEEVWTTSRNQANRWLLTRIADPNGNEVRFEYLRDGAHSLSFLRAIRFNHHVVTFYYEARPDPVAEPLGDGTLAVATQRLRTVDVQTEVAPGDLRRVRAYRLTYTP